MLTTHQKFVLDTYFDSTQSLEQYYWTDLGQRIREGNFGTACRHAAFQSVSPAAVWARMEQDLDRLDSLWTTPLPPPSEPRGFIVADLPLHKLGDLLDELINQGIDPELRFRRKEGNAYYFDILDGTEPTRNTIVFDKSGGFDFQTMIQI